MVYVWSMLYYMKSLDNKQESLENIYRTLRLFYIRYNNYDRAVEKSIGNVDTILEKGPWDNDVLNKEEEQDKYGFLKGKDKVFEEWIWKIEDHPLNLNGRDVGGKNCSHLVKFDKSLSVDQLQKIFDSFCDIFPIEGDKYRINNHKLLLNSLIYTSIFECEAKPFWDKENKWYYERLNFDRENRFIRGLSTYGENQVFKVFFDKYISDKEYLEKTKDEIEKKMSAEGVDKNNIGSLKITWPLAWFAASLKGKMWEQGYYIAFNRIYNLENGIENKQFPDVFLENFKGDFRGGNPQLLSDLIEKQI